MQVYAPTIGYDSRRANSRLAAVAGEPHRSKRGSPQLAAPSLMLDKRQGPSRGSREGLGSSLVHALTMSSQ